MDLKKKKLFTPDPRYDVQIDCHDFFLDIAIINIWDRDVLQQCIMGHSYSMQVIMHFRTKLSKQKTNNGYSTLLRILLQYSVLKSV